MDILHQHIANVVILVLHILLFILKDICNTLEHVLLGVVGLHILERANPIQVLLLVLAEELPTLHFFCF